MGRPSPLRFLAAVLAGGVLTLTAAPPAGAASPLEVVEVAVGADRQVTAVVGAPRGLANADIPAQAFSVFENGEPRPVGVTRLPHETLDVALVVDTSGSMAGRPMAAAKAAALSFIGRLPAGTRVALVAFGDKARVVSGFTADRAVLTAAVKGLVPRGETALYDALVATAGQFPAEGAVRRSVVLLSDGGDTVSVSSLDDTLARLSAMQADFSAVALATSESDTAALESLAAAGRGHLVPAGDPGQLAAAYESIAARLVSRYRLQFPAQTAGRSEFRIALNLGGVQAEALHSLDVPAAPAPAPPVEEVRPETVPAPGFFQQAWLLPVGALAFAAALALAGWFLGAVREPRSTLVVGMGSVRAAAPAAGEQLRTMSGRAKAAAVSAAERVLERRRQTGALNRALDRAGIAMRPAEFLVLAGACTFSGFAVGLLLAGLVAGMVLAGLVAGGFRVVVASRAQRRQSQFAEQLSDTLAILAGSLRTGYGLIQALDTVARESESPSREEFGRVVVEARLGRDLSESLRSLADRVGNEDFDWVTQAIGIHRDVGGDLAEVLDKVGETIRDRNRVRRQVRALSAEGRISAVVLFALPFGVAFFVGLTNPGYLGELTGRSGGRWLLALAAVQMAVGGLWLRRLVRLRF